MGGVLLIAGAGGHGKVVADAALSTGKWDEVMFLDDAWPGKKGNGRWGICGKIENLPEWRLRCKEAVVAIGNNRLRLIFQQRLADAGFEIASVVHPSARISPFSQVGAGSVVFANAVVNVDAIIGEGAIINTAATIDHDCRLGRGVHISPGAHLSGGVSVGEFSWIGIGGVVRELISIGSDVTVAAGAAVVADIPDGITVMGVPARPMNKNK
ncbi:MAG: acetyltransferase [Nitrospirae bacterium]|nr:acetyltransferase [Candidatus Manganitrophaceae bacterium]